ncbi:hypothetical protein RI367_001989 [Sorochytrium milnesiophthora]
MQLFKSYGKLLKLDYRWHLQGPKRGMPRGFAFVDIEPVSEAERAIRELHGKSLLGRSLVVNFATEVLLPSFLSPPLVDSLVEKAPPIDEEPEARRIKMRQKALLETKYSTLRASADRLQKAPIDTKIAVLERKLGPTTTSSVSAESRHNGRPHLKSTLPPRPATQARHHPYA